LHIASPSTIPLTLGEEMAVLCCHKYFTKEPRPSTTKKMLFTYPRSPAFIRG
jgi:hypothetical protein